MAVILWLVVISGYILSLVIILNIFVLAISFFKEAPYVASNARIIKESISQLNLKEGDRFVDIGAGDGRVVRRAAKDSNYKCDNYTGIEISQILNIQSQIMNVFSMHSQKIHYIKTDIFSHNYSQYNKIFMYLTTDLTEKIMEKLEKEVPEGTVVVSAVFNLGNFHNARDVAKKEVKIGNKLYNLYIWTKQ